MLKQLLQEEGNKVHIILLVLGNLHLLPGYQVFINTVIVFKG